ncbi:uncharacterized protein CDAR_186101 [Caerostris darwini]|uniref:Uncharacterized protein n=1 Tax=Caerostris darwini TaxID=1538125 RepID=A0AAV4WBA5_9ARAC|nr:uncharacterized protein CDAR_186101 [Caerostris darwini]
MGGSFIHCQTQALLQVEMRGPGVVWEGRQSGSLVISQRSSAELALKGITQIPRRSANFADRRIGAVGGKARGPNGKACVIEGDAFDELLRVYKRTTGSKNVQCKVNYIDVHVESNIVRNYGIDQEAAIQEIGRLEPSQAEAVPLMQTSVMVPIDCTEPNVDDEIEISDNGNEIGDPSRN